MLTTARPLPGILITIAGALQSAPCGWSDGQKQPALSGSGSADMRRLKFWVLYHALVWYVQQTRGAGNRIKQHQWLWTIYIQCSTFLEVKLHCI